MSTVSSGRHRRSAAGAVVVLALAMGYPVHAAGQAADADVVIAGGNATDRVDCRSGGTAPGSNRCEALAEGGDVSLTNVDIHFKPGDSLQVNGGSVDAVTVGGGDATAGAVCIDESGRSVDPRQVSRCRARAQGGAVRFNNVQVILHRRNGSTTTKRRNLVALRARPTRRSAECGSQGQPSASCGANASGGLVAMRNVDMFDRRTNTTRTNISVSVRGGNASAFVICGTVGSGSSRCSATARGGDAALQDVRLHVYER
jgi:hypothetical protein